jgi:lipooligosaccharide transport system ATP-binding protein
MQVDPLEVENLVKTYSRSDGSKVPAVRGISFSVKEGECFGLLGPNGAGKSTTIECITGFFPPTQGSVKVLGLDVHHSPKKARQHLGVCSQDSTLDTDFTVLDQLIRHASFFRISKTESKRRAEELLERFQLSAQADSDIEELSGGMKRRLQVARSLISNPQVLLLDEPTTGLDPDARRNLWSVIAEERKKGTAMVLSTHYMDEAERLCDRIAILHQGRILDIASPKELIRRHAPELEVKEEVRPGFIHKRPANLEDVFLRLTGEGLNGKSFQAENLVRPSKNNQLGELT